MSNVGSTEQCPLRVHGVPRRPFVYKPPSNSDSIDKTQQPQSFISTNQQSKHGQKLDMLEEQVEKNDASKQASSKVDSDATPDQG